MTYQPQKLILVSQGISRSRSWVYEDTGSGIATILGAGFFTDAGYKGAKVGDTIEVRDLTTAITQRGRFTTVQDTGATQGTVTADTG